MRGVVIVEGRFARHRPSCSEILVRLKIEPREKKRCRQKGIKDFKKINAGI